MKVAGPSQLQIVCVFESPKPAKMTQIRGTAARLGRERYIASIKHLYRSVKAGVWIPGCWKEKVSGNAVLNKTLLSQKFLGRQGPEGLRKVMSMKNIELPESRSKPSYFQFQPERRLIQEWEFLD